MARRSLFGVLLISFILTVSGTSAADEVRIATFNIQTFGQAKVNKPAIRLYLAEIIRNFDIVAIQEVKDVSQATPDIFLSAVNDTGRHYAYLLSERTGKQSDDRDSQEQYAFYFDTDRIDVVDQGALFDDSAHDLFQREPFTARFGVKGMPFTFTLTTIHTRPESAVAEIGALYAVYHDVEKRYPREYHHLILGDFNAGCSYASPAELDDLAIRAADFHWIVPDTADTNVDPDHACAYDRLVANSALFSHFKLWGIANWFIDKRVSDHWPVWVTFDTAHP